MTKVSNSSRMKVILERFPVAYAEMEPGDGIFFHCNLLHASEPNLSDRPRRACRYSRISPAASMGARLQEKKRERANAFA